MDSTKKIAPYPQSSAQRSARQRLGAANRPAAASPVVRRKPNYLPTPPSSFKKNSYLCKKIQNVSKFKSAIQALGRRFAALPPRIGIIALVLCALFYAASFLQMLLPITVATKSILWIILFGLAKTTQYTAVAILGKEGIRLILRKFHHR